MPVHTALDDKPLSDVPTAEVAKAAQAASLADCHAFLFVALGPANAGLIHDLLA